MTQVLHTADVHLAPNRQERIDGLRTLLDCAEGSNVDVVTIGGDLFDDPDAVDELRPDLRNDLFADRAFEVLLIPGNHDVEAFRGDVFFGDACTVFVDDPFGQWTAPDGDLRITALPYRERPDDDLLLSLKNRAPFDGTEALLLHCSLDAPFDDDGTGEEGTRQYFPVSSELLGELGFDYVLAGHYHSPHKLSLPNGAEFTYPGTPASTRRSETGRRRVSLLDPSTGFEFENLDTFHYLSREYTVTPGAEQEVLEEVRQWADQQVTDAANASIRVDGFLEMNEEAFNERLTSAAGPATVTDETRNVSHVRAHPLYQSFEAELEEMDWDDGTIERATERTVAVFSRLAARGEL